MLFTLAVFLKSALVVAVRGGLGGARGGGGGARLGCCGCSSSLSGEASTSVGSGVKADFLLSLVSRAYMLSFAYVLECEGYGKLILDDVFSEPNEPRRPISGTTAIL